MQHSNILVKKLSSTALCACMAISAFPMSANAAEGVSIQLTGDNTAGQTISGMFYNEAEGVPTTKDIVTNSNGIAYFALPSKDYELFDYSLNVKGNTITNTISVKDIKDKQGDYVENVDITWAEMLGILGATETSSDKDEVYNTIKEDGTVAGTENSGNNKNNNSSTGDKKPNTSDNAENNSVGKTKIKFKVQGNCDSSLLKESASVILSNEATTVAFKVKLNGSTTEAKSNIPNGAYDVTVSDTTNAIKCNSTVVVSNNTCTITLDVTPKCVLYVVDSTETNGTPYNFIGFDKEFNSNTEKGVAVENKADYTVRKQGAPKAYAIQIPAYADEYYLDLGTGKAYTAKNDDKVNEELQGTDDNPFDIPPTTDMGYNTLSAAKVRAIVGIFIVLVLLSSVAAYFWFKRVKPNCSKMPK